MPVKHDMGRRRCQIGKGRRILEEWQSAGGTTQVFPADSRRSRAPGGLEQRRVDWCESFGVVTAREADDNGASARAKPLHRAGKSTCARVDVARTSRTEEREKRTHLIWQGRREVTSGERMAMTEDGLHARFPPSQQSGEGRIGAQVVAGWEAHTQQRALPRKLWGWRARGSNKRGEVGRTRYGARAAAAGRWLEMRNGVVRGLGRWVPRLIHGGGLRC